MCFTPPAGPRALEESGGHGRSGRPTEQNFCLSWTPATRPTISSPSCLEAGGQVGCEAEPNKDEARCRSQRLRRSCLYACDSPHLSLSPRPTFAWNLEAKPLLEVLKVLEKQGAT